MGGNGKSVESGGIQAENVFATGGRVVRDEPMDPGVGGGEQAYGPVRSEHEAIRPEGLEDDIKVWLEVLWLPSLPISFSDKPAEFAEDIFARGDFSHVRGPGIDGAGPDERLGEMIDDEALAREALDEFGRSRELPGIDQDVVAETELFELRDASQKIFGEQKAVVGFRLRDMAKSTEFFEAGKMFQPCAEIWRAQIDPADDSGDFLIRGGEIEQEICLVFGLNGLNGDARIDSGGFNSGRRSEGR